MLRGGFQKQSHHDFRIRAVGNSDRKIQASLGLGKRPIDDLAGNEVSVRDDYLCPLKRLDRAGADADPRDFSSSAVDLENIVDVDRPLDLQDQSRNEIVDDVLQAKTDTNADCAGEDSEFIQLHASHVHGGQEHHQQNYVVERG